MTSTRQTPLSNAANAAVKDSQSAAAAAANAAAEQCTAASARCGEYEPYRSSCTSFAPSAAPVAITGNGSGARGAARIELCRKGAVPLRRFHCRLGLLRHGHVGLCIAFGVSLPHSFRRTGSYGTATPSLAQAQPGDILANGPTQQSMWATACHQCPEPPGGRR